MTANGNAGYARLRKLLADYKAKSAAIETTLALLGENAQESASERAETTLASALQLDRERRQGHYTHLSDDEKERRRSIVHHFLARQPLSSMRSVMGELRHRGIDLSPDQVRRLLHDLPGVERIGERVEARYRLTRPASRPATRKAPTKKTKRVAHQHKGIRVEQSAGFSGTTAEKARTVVQLVRDADGGLISLSDLVVKAREAGITSLTGIVNYTRAGWLRRTRDRKGQNAYRFLAMPPEPAHSAPAE